MRNHSYHLVTMVYLLTATAFAQAPFYPDRYPDEDKGPTRYRENAGQVIDTHGDPVTAVKYSAEGSPLGIHLADKSTVHYTWAATYKDSTLADTTFRVDMTFEKGRSVAPHRFGITPDIANYYLGAVVAEEVKAYHRVIYNSVWDSIDVHFHHGSSGPRMSFVIRPGGAPEDIDLRFNGQDSLKVDWQGRLEVWLKNKWIKFEGAVAYQVGTLGNITPVSWTATYEHAEGSAHVNFQLGDHNANLPLILQLGLPPLPNPPTVQGNLEWSTYVGGNGGDELESVEVDELGDVYVCGVSWAYNFPVNPGSNEHIPFVEFPSGMCNAVVMKFRATNKRLSWATYYGGNGDDTWYPKTKAAALAVYTGSQPHRQFVYATGSTSAEDFNVWRTPGSVFSNAHVAAFDGGTSRMWVGAFRKNDGIRDWATTHGELGGDRTWGEHGLTIDLDPGGRLALGGMLESHATPYPVDFEVITPPGMPGALARPDGDGFLLCFDGNYQIHWSSTLLCGYAGGNVGVTRITDIDFGPKAGGGPGLWFVGVNWSSACEMHYVPPGDGFYQTDGGHAVIGVLDMDTYKLDYCTAWGGGLEIPYAIHHTDEAVWVAGFTTAQGLTDVELPPPPGIGSGAIYTTTHAGALGGQWSDGFMLRYKGGTYGLDYGTLVGGLRDDILLDITSDADQNVYLTGETRSNSGFSHALDAGYYQQATFGIPNRRDALLIGISSGAYPRAFWRSAFGGSQSDRGWGIAASADEILLVGSSASQYTDGFPLREFSSTSDLDYYQPVNLMGSASWFIPWVEFNLAMDLEHTGFGEAAIEPDGSPHDGFIASFGIDPVLVGLPNAPVGSGLLQVHGTPLPGVWRLALPRNGSWSYRIYDTTGRVVVQDHTAGNTILVDLSAYSPGVYAVALHDGESRYTTKLLRP